MEFKDVKLEKTNIILNKQLPSKSDFNESLFKEHAHLSIYDLSFKLRESWDNKNADDIIFALQQIKGCCKVPNDLVSSETFFPIIFPILIFSLNCDEYKGLENFPYIAVQAESISILKGISSIVGLKPDLLKQTLVNIYSLLFDSDNFRPEYMQIFEQCFSILTTFVNRGGFYAEATAEHLYVSRFLNFLGSISSSPLKHAAVIFISSFKSLELIKNLQRASMMAEIIQNSDFIDLDRLILFNWFFKCVPNPYSYFNPGNYLSFLHVKISDKIENESDQPMINKCKSLAIDNLVLLINHLNSFINFDYPIIFLNCLPGENHKLIDENIFLSSLKCMVAVASFRDDGLPFLLSNIDIRTVLYGVFNDGHTIITKKTGLLLINKIIGNDSHSRELALQILNDGLMISIINFLEIDDDESLIKDVFNCFDIIIGDYNNHDEICQRFFKIFENNDGWKLVDDLSYNESIAIHNCALKFVQSYSNEILQFSDDDEWPQD